MTTNPLFAKTPTPAFDQIKEADFKPALTEATARVTKAYEALRDSREAPDFENTVVPFDTLFAEIRDIHRVLNNLSNMARTDTLLTIEEEANKDFDSLAKTIFQDRKLAARVKEVWDKKDSLGLDEEDQWFFQNLYWQFEDNGAFLSADEQAELKTIDAALITQATKFRENFFASQKHKAVHWTKEDLKKNPGLFDGVPKTTVNDFAEKAKDAGKDGWLFLPERLMVDQLLETAEDRNFRKAIYDGIDSLGTEPPYDNRPVIAAICGLRDKRAKLLGYQDYADAHLSQTMAGSVQNVMDLFRKSVHGLLPQYEADMKTLESWAAQKGGPAKLEPWDVPYYAEKYKEETFQFNSSEFSEYLALDNVLEGWLAHVSKSFEVDFTPTTAYPTWNDDVLVYETTNRKSGEKAVLYIDPYSRPEEKHGGAWMDEVQAADPAQGKLNAIVFTMNLSKPKNGAKALLNISQLQTFYHEGGHAMNGLTGSKPKYQSRRGTGNSTDFLETHSMLQENWAVEPDILKTFAFHHKTGDVIPDELIKTMKASNKFLATREPLKVIQNALRDLMFHQLSWDDDFPGPDAIHEAADLDSDYSAHIRSYPLTRFDHLFSSGLSQYAAGYYGYYLSDVNQATAYEAFQDKGLYDQATLTKMREFYASGGGRESNRTYEHFTGKKSGNPRAFLKGLGIDLPPQRDSAPTPDKPAP